MKKDDEYYMRMPPDWWMMKDTERQGYIEALDDLQEFILISGIDSVPQLMELIDDMKKDMFIKRGGRRK